MDQATPFTARLIVAAGMVMAGAFWILTGDNGVGLALLKGASVAVLGLYALVTLGRAGLLLATVLLAGAVGDVAIEFDTVAGGGFFLLSHLVAIALYRRHRRPVLSASQRAAAIALVMGVPLGAWVLTHDPLAVVYAAALGTMAASAWVSRFSRYWVGIGALAFVASDMFIFARLGGVLDPDFTGWLIWPLYYAGQLLIATGAVHVLRRQAGAER